MWALCLEARLTHWLWNGENTWFSSRFSELFDEIQMKSTFRCFQIFINAFLDLQIDFQCWLPGNQWNKHITSFWSCPFLISVPARTSEKNNPNHCKHPRSQTFLWTKLETTFEHLYQSLAHWSRKNVAPNTQNLFCA